MTPDEVIHIQNMEPVSRKPVTLELASILLAGESRFKKKFTAVALSADEIMLYREKSSSAALLSAKKEGEDTTGVSGSTEVKSRMKGDLGFPKTLLPKREVLRNIIIDLVDGKTKQEFAQGTIFVILPNDFMTPEQQTLYKKLNTEQRRFYLNYIRDELIGELEVEFQVIGDIREYDGLPELEFLEDFTGTD